MRSSGFGSAIARSVNRMSRSSKSQFLSWQYCAVPMAMAFLTFLSPNSLANKSCSLM